VQNQQRSEATSNCLHAGCLTASRSSFVCVVVERLLFDSEHLHARVATVSLVCKFSAHLPCARRLACLYTDVRTTSLVFCCCQQCVCEAMVESNGLEMVQGVHCMHGLCLSLLFTTSWAGPCLPAHRELCYIVSARVASSTYFGCCRSGSWLCCRHPPPP
jgi:hypothetical protein